MKLIRIGSSPSCDIVLKSDFVSVLHAEMTIMDDGTITLEDKNSKNGTKVGNNPVTPGSEVTVQRGDLITFADKTLVWAQVPKAEVLAGYTAIYNIGSNYRNEIILNSQAVSRFHASLRIKNGKAFIHDNGSRNGTLVNGVKIEANKDICIKKGDNIVCGTEDVTEQVSTLLPKNRIGKILAYAGSSVAAVIVIAFVISKLMPTPHNDNPVIYTPSDFRPAVVYVRAYYHPVVVFDDDNPLKGLWDGKYHLKSYKNWDFHIGYQGTAFFLDSLGRMGTNRHIAVPWEYMEGEEEEKIRQTIEENLPLHNLQTYDDLTKFFNTSIFGDVVYIYAMTKHKNVEDRIKCVVDVVARLRKAKYTITGELDEIQVGYAGKYYTHPDEYQRCNVLAVSDNKDIDLAILQLNDKKTPLDIPHIFSPDKFFMGTLEPLKEELYTIGYPSGIRWAQDNKTKSMEPAIRETKCSKEPGKYDFEFQANSTGGSSGSPVFNKYGQLVGVLWGGKIGDAAPTMAVHAKFLKKMYDEEVNM